MFYSSTRPRSGGFCCSAAGQDTIPRAAVVLCSVVLETCESSVATQQGQVPLADVSLCILFSLSLFLSLILPRNFRRGTT